MACKQLHPLQFQEVCTRMCIRILLIYILPPHILAFKDVVVGASKSRLQIRAQKVHSCFPPLCILLLEGKAVVELWSKQRRSILCSSLAWFVAGNAIAEQATVITRIAQTFLRFGSFEIFKPTDSTTGCH